ncbi:DUF2142 domain-containing protein [Blautia sp. HCP3S3_H10_1]|uniref:DUF2142 domain-containing protein n=1 Tax=unclassified Blautia TaxID=2648079 RepID=UPI003F8DA4B2|nr:DUF2142 domain-containing protein [Clostridia bacterium]
MFIRNKISRIVIEAVLAVAIALLVELGFNYQAIINGYSPVSISESTTDSDGKLIYQKEFEEPVYIKKLIVQGTVKKKRYYNVTCTAINDFGKEETVELKEYMYPGLEAAFTNINRKIVKLEIVFKRPSKVKLSGISYSNELVFNKYRMLFFGLVSFLAILLIFEKQFILKRVWLFYLVGAVGFGGIIAIDSGPYAISWDEEVHYATVYNADFSSEVSLNPAAQLNFVRNNWTAANSSEEQYMIREYLDQLAGNTEETYSNPSSLRNYITHFPMILMYHLAERAGASYVGCYILGRLGNLVFCALLTAIAIIVAKRKKVLIAALGMMPTVIFQESMYTYDGWIFSTITLGVVLCMNELEKVRGNENIRNVIGAVILLGIGCVAKPVYCPLILLIVPILWEKGKRLLDTKVKKAAGICVAALVVLLAIGVIVIKIEPLLENILTGNLLYGGDSRGGNTGIVGQLLSMLEHPLATVKMFIRDIFSFDNFRNNGETANNTTLIFNQMFLNFYVLGMLKEVWALLLLPLLLLLFLVKPQGENTIYYNLKRNRWYCIINVFLSVVLIWLAMYLTFSPIGAGQIKGVQARYFLPLLLPVAFIVENDRINIKISRVRYYQIVLGSSLLLCSECIYRCLIVKRV